MIGDPAYITGADSFSSENGIHQLTLGLFDPESFDQVVSGTGAAGGFLFGIGFFRALDLGIFDFHSLFIGAVFAGSVLSLSVVWNLADIANALMAIPNLIAILLLSGVIVAETRKYLWNNRLDDDSGEVPPTL